MMTKHTPQIVVAGNHDLHVSRLLLLHHIFNLVHDGNLEDCEVAEEIRLTFANQMALLTPEQEEVQYMERYQ